MYTEHGTLDRDEILQRCAPMVRRVASQLAARLPANVEFDELVQAGMIGLMDALSRYESDQGAQFETFAMQRVRGAMLDELRSSDWMPRSVRKSQRTIEAAIHRVEQRNGRTASEAEIAEEMGLSLADFQAKSADARGAQLVHLDDFEDEDGNSNYLDRHVAAADADPVKILGDARFRQALVAAIERLPEREKMVMGMYYEHDMNLKEIGAVLGVTESRVSQIHSQAVARLRTQLRPWT